jgi:hypothetical protein
MTITTRRTAALGALLAAAAAPLIALSTSAIAAADPNDLWEEPIDSYGTSGSYGAPDSINNPTDGTDFDITGTPGTETLSGDLDVAGTGIADPIGTFNESNQTVSLGTDSYLYSDNSTDTYQDVVGGTPNGDSIVQDYSSVWDTTNSGSTFTELWGSDFTETLNSAGNLINVADTVDLFGHAVTLFDLPL